MPKKKYDNSWWSDKEKDQGYAFRRVKGRLVRFSEDGPEEYAKSKYGDKAYSKTDAQKRVAIKNKNRAKNKPGNINRLDENKNDKIQSKNASPSDFSKKYARQYESVEDRYNKDPKFRKLLRDVGKNSPENYDEDYKSKLWVKMEDITGEVITKSEFNELLESGKMYHDYENWANNRINDAIKNSDTKNWVSEKDVIVEDRVNSKGQIEKANSLGRHMINGEFDEETKKLHNEIIRDYFKDKLPVGDENKVFYMTGGGSGTGKSNFLRNGYKNFGEDLDYNEKTGMLDANVIKIDADDLKKRLYEKRSDGFDHLEASYLHEESSALSKRITELALSNNYPALLDSTGDGTPEKLSSKIDDAKKYGFKVKAAYGTCGFQKGLQNNFERWKRAVDKGDKGARYVREEDVVSLHRDVTNTLIAVADKFDNVVLSDMNNFNDIKIIARGGSGNKLAIEKGREKEYNMFVEKGKLTNQQVLEIANGYKKVVLKSGKRKESDYND